MKQTWSILRKAINKQNDKSSFPQHFLINNRLNSNKDQAAHAFNKYYSKIGLDTSANIPVTQSEFSKYMPDPTLDSMVLENVDLNHITKVTKQLKPKSSYGHDQISTKLLKESINNIGEPITYIINRSLSTGIVPDKMKIAKVIPIYKNSDPLLIKNYRPVSLLTAFSKLLEKIMYSKVLNFLQANQSLYKHQYGFRSKHSTIHPIIHLINNCAEANNKRDKEFTLAIFCDLSKAFDVINHKILLKKLYRYGIRGNALKWFKSYLSDRLQFVELDGNQSTMENILCGVPQG
jgi:hypothetical protein